MPLPPIRCRRGPRIALLLCIAAAPAARASDGRIEINETRALAGGITPGDGPGFPVTITQPGSYVLTGNLTVDANTTAIRIQADEVSLDLNGFGVIGPRTSIGSGIGIEATVGSDRVVVSDGFVVGTGSHGVQLRLDSRIERVSAFDCRGNGIMAASGSTVIGSRASENDLVGFSLGADVAMAMNVATANSGEEVVGGRGIGDNRCDGRPCRSTALRRFYLTQSNVNGAQAAGACAAGFHMASIWEIRSPEHLVYDTTLGTMLGDSGAGPPSGPTAAGWARTGNPPEIEASTFTDLPNCQGYTSSAPTHRGSRFNLTNNVTAAPIQATPWEHITQTCNVSDGVWCIED